MAPSIASIAPVEVAGYPLEKSQSPVLIIDNIVSPYPFAMFGHWCDWATWQTKRIRKTFEDVHSLDTEVAAIRTAMLNALIACEALLAAALTPDQRALMAKDEARLRQKTDKPKRRPSSHRGVAVGV
jgi:hypothetical protein